MPPLIWPVFCHNQARFGKQCVFISSKQIIETPFRRKYDYALVCPGLYYRCPLLSVCGLDQRSCSTPYPIALSDEGDGERGEASVSTFVPADRQRQIPVSAAYVACLLIDLTISGVFMKKLRTNNL
jgi:hypothetical protein